VKPLFSRADLLRVAHVLGDDARTAVAEAHGFEREEPPPEIPPAAQVPPPPESTPAAPLPGGADEALAPTPLWQPRSFELHHVEELDARVQRAQADAEAADAAGYGRGSAAEPPKSPPLSPWRRLGPILHAALTVEREGHRLDLPRLVRHLAQGRRLARLPRIVRRGWTPLEVLVDRPLRLAPFWNDQARVVHELDRMLGRRAVALRVLANGPGSEPDEAARRRGWARGTVLALTDLGLYGGEKEREAWTRIGLELHARGTRVAALLPVPRARWTTTLARVWRALPWERPTGGAAAVDPGTRAEQVQRLLGYLAPAMRIEPGLVRTIRWILPRAEADVGVEADLWVHDVLGDMYPEYRVIDATQLEGLRHRFTAEVPAEDQARVIAALRAWHWHRELLPEAWHLEVLALQATLGDAAARAAGITEIESERARGFLRWLDRDVAGTKADAEEADTLRRWCNFVRAQVPREVWDPNTPAGEALQTIAFRVGGVDVPNADPTLHEAVTKDRPPEPREVLLTQVACALVSADNTALPVGSPLATLVLARPLITLASEAVPEATLDLTRPGARFSAPPRGRVELRADRSTLVLDPLTKPAWARAVGRDRFGLWAELLFKRDDEDPGVPYRMRWIPPGRFRMGSPDDEPGRFEDEGPQHLVVITRGLWLGETLVTQALWQAVTGQNPSEFKTPDRPVENITWVECQEHFLARLSRAFPGERGEIFRLPTEAEWEYACRAGTTTATYAGPMQLRGENDAPVLDAIAWYGGNSGVAFDLPQGRDSSSWRKKQHPHTKAGTRRVAQKLPNSWGLYDMLGNVWEWCSDWSYRRYSASSSGDSGSSSVVADPVGPATGEYRVMRGGSWDYDARHLRAASRYAFPPGSRHASLGLRLARGQGVWQDPGPEGSDPEGRWAGV